MSRRRSLTVRAISLFLVGGALLWWFIHRSGTKYRAVYELSNPTVATQGPFKGALVQTDLATGKIRYVEGRAVMQANTPLEAANTFVNAAAGTLAKGVDPGELKVIRSVESLTGTNVTYGRYENGLYVVGNQLSVQVASDGKTITSLRNELTDIDTVGNTQSLGSAAGTDNDTRRLAAIELALKSVHAKASAAFGMQAKPVVVSGKTGGTGGWQLTFLTSDPPGSWRVATDADGHTLLNEPSNVAQFAEGRAMVFAPNPVQYKGDAGISAYVNGSFNADDPIINSTRILVTVHNLDNSGFLQGDYATTALMAPKDRARETTHVYNYPRSDKRFGELMAYHWVTECELYLQSLGYVNTPQHKRAINLRPVGIHPHFTMDDNSFYSPDLKTLQFGDGGVIDAEDAEVILHELGHAIQDDQRPDFGGSIRHTEARAMGEGFGDYWAASFFSGVGPAAWHIYWDKWDGQTGGGSHAASGGSPAYLRRLDSTKHYPEGWLGEEHADGEMWSACLWAIHELIGRKQADMIILESHYNLPPGGTATFAQGANAILAANQALFGSNQQAAITKIFVDRGILSK
jgi:Zn-dependent metalloprotease